MKTIILIPIWFIVSIIAPLLPETHPLYMERRPLRDWRERGTPAAVIMGITVWWHIFLVAAFGLLRFI